jgi:hypothetical protein
VKRLLADGCAKERKLLEEHGENIELAARELIKNEVLDEQSFKKLLNVKAICRQYTG